jgi:type I restriction enzyme R subunit
VGQFGEADTVQAAVVDRLTTVGWKHVPGAELARSAAQVLIEDDVRDALLRLNPAIAQHPGRVDEVLPRLRAATLSVGDEGLTAANERFTEWLRGLSSYRFVGTEHHVPIRLVDFDDPQANRLVVSDEVTFVGADERRYDVVLWVNGIPLVVGETKTATDKNTSWLNAACDVHDVYEARTPQFSVPNLCSFATDGREFHYGAIGQPADSWLVWGSTADPTAAVSLSSTLRQLELLADPATLLTILRDFVLFTRSTSAGTSALRKLLPRYPQVEATRAIVARIKDPLRRQGLVWHHQGSGKTLTMAFVAGVLRRDLEMDAPTILVVLDRLDLFEQVIA